MSLIESLTGNRPVRPDARRILPIRRPLFSRPRDVLEIIVALGAEASMASIYRSVELHAADPRTLTAVVLSRWPTEEELARLPTPYRPQQQLRALLTGPEFRGSLFRRICDSYPELPRQLFLRIPRCAGQHFLATAGDMHPIFPTELAHYQPGDENRFIPALGTFLSRFTQTRTLMAWQPHLAPFIQAPTPERNPTYEAAGLNWPLNAPPRRPPDRLFAIIRDPATLLLSHVNATLDAANPTADPAARKTLARKILHTTTLKNPICHAIADGTATRALRTARHQDLELVDLGKYTDWIKYTWDIEPEPSPNPATPHLKPADLTQADQTHLKSLTDEDQIFYTAFKTAESQLPSSRYAIRGRDLP